MDGAVLDERHGRAPRQDRSRRTLTRIVAAAEALFAERGYDGTTVGDIASRARCSVGTFYARFNDKESLFLHLHDQQCGQLLQRIEFLCDLFRAENATLEVMVRQTVRGLFVFAGERRAMTRVFIQRSGADPAFHERYARSWGEVRERLLPLWLARRSEIGHPEPDRAADFALQLIHAAWANDVLHHRVAALTGQQTGDALIDDLTEACLAWLGVGGKAGR